MIVRLAVVVILLGLLAVPVFLWAFQTYGVYRFAKTGAGPESLSLTGVERVELAATDGEKIFAWVAQPEAGQPIIVSFHGNFTEAAPSFERIVPLVSQGHGVVMLEYRGSGAAPGRLNEKRMKADAEVVYDALGDLIEGGIEGRKIISHGYSLGTSPGIWLAANRPVDGLVVEAGFARLTDYWERRYFSVPIFRLMWAERLENQRDIAAVSAPVLMLHGAKDPALPLAWPQASFDAVSAPKKFVLYPEGAHSDLVDHGMVADVTAFVADPAGFVAAD